MSTHTFPADTPAGLLLETCAIELRPPVSQSLDASGQVIVEFSPDLSPTEATTLASIVGRLRSPIPFSNSTYSAVRTEMQNLRALRQMGRNAFMALTAAERDRLMYDAMTSATIVLLAILRDD